MKTAAKLLCIALAVGLAACSSYDPPEMETGHRTSFDGEVLRIEIEREDGGTERFSTLRDRWFGWSWVPFLPNHAGRRWALLKADRDGTSIAYTVVSWDNDDNTDYLAAGYWLRFEGFDPSDEIPLAAGDIVLFIDGTEIDPANPPELPLSGTASYVGEAGGIYAYRYGSDWTGTDEPEAGEEFYGTMTAEANFDDMTIAGCVGCVGDLRIERMHLFGVLGWRVDRPLAMPTDYEIHFAPTTIEPEGSFLGEDVTVTHPTRTVTESGGDWGGTFSNRPASDGNPRFVAGIASAAFVEADGSEGSFDSIFITTHPSLLPETQPD